MELANAGILSGHKRGVWCARFSKNLQVFIFFLFVYNRENKLDFLFRVEKKAGRVSDWIFKILI